LVYIVAYELFLAITALPWLLYIFVVDTKFGFIIQAGTHFRYYSGSLYFSLRLV